MVRNSKKKGLYEIIVGAKSKPSYEQLHPRVEKKQPAEQPATAGDASPGVWRWVRKPRLVQFNAGRIEFSLPYQIGIAIALGAVLVLVVAFRLGELLGSRAAARYNLAQASSAPANRDAVQTPPAVEQRTNQQAVTAPASTGRNRIVIQMYQVRMHLEPVREYFEKMGVATEIIAKNNWYYLVTKNKYDSVDRPGSDGYLAKQKIIELGAGYNAPAGYETFRKADGTTPFSDAFGMRFEE
jgi:hypothetical protein